jgi:outer membrane receptor protein involved in Fe transport
MLPHRYFARLASRCLDRSGFASASLALALSVSSLAAQPAKRAFDLAANDAAVSLKVFIEQSGHDVVYPADTVRGTRTNPVKGTFTPKEAIDRMLEGTRLVAVQGRSGMISVRRANDPNVPRAAPQSSDRPDAPSQLSDRSNPDEQSPNTMKRKNLFAMVASWLAVAAAPLPAQAAESVAKDSAITLSPFEVREDSDNGYTATSALSGGRTDTPLKLTAAAISVMTSQFLADIAATDLQTAMEWSNNYVPQLDLNHQAGSGHTINLRNMGSSFQSRNHFMWYVPSDSYNTERYEFSRGPNGVLFGDAGAGGISTNLTKRARFDAVKTSASLWGTSFGGYRSTLDHNRPLGRNMAVRFNALYENMPSWRQNTDNMRWGAHLAGSYRFTPKNQFRFEVEKGGYNRALYANYILDQGSYWNGTTSYDGVTAPSTAGTGVARIATTPYLVYIPGTPNGGLNDYQTFYQTVGSGIGLYPGAQQRTDLPNLARWPYKDWNMQPVDSYSRLNYYTYSAYLDHRFSDNFYIEGGYNRTRQIYNVNYNQFRFADYRVDVNRVLPGGAPNPNFGKPYADLNARLTGQSENTMDEIRLMANYRFDATSWWKQSFSAIGGSRIDKFNSYGRSMRRVNGTSPDINNAANQIRERRYWDQIGTSFGPPPQIPGVELAYVPTTHSRQRKTIDYFQLLSISRFFNDRLALSLGARRDGVLAYAETSQAGVNGYPVIGGTILQPNGAVLFIPGAKARTEVDPTSTNAGIVYYVFRDLGVFANYSETFSTPGAGPNFIDGREPGISQSQGYDVGFKLELFNGKISGAVSYYSSEQKERAVGSIRQTEIDRIWANLNRLDKQVVSYRDTEDVEGTGYELDITANPTRNLRLSLNYAIPEASAVNLRPDLRAYFAANLATWQAGANDASNPNRTQIQNDINAIQNDINGLTPGTLFNGTYKYTSNVYATYTLPARWKNVSVGAGANIRGRQKIGNVQVLNGVANNQPYNYLWADAYYLVSAHATYRHRFSDKLSARFQLNIANLLDSDKLMYRGYGTYRVGGIASNPLLQLPNNVAMPDPRKFTLSATFDF